MRQGGYKYGDVINGKYVAKVYMLCVFSLTRI